MNDDEKIKICNGLIYGRGRINERKMEYGIIDYDHIPETLWHYRIEKIQAKNMLLEMQGHYSFDMVNKIIQPNIRFLDQWEPDNEGGLTIETQNLVYVLDKFIKDATNITIDLEYSKVYSPIRLSNFKTEYLEPAALQYNKFIKALKKELKRSLKTDLIYADLKSDVFPIIERYTTWYVKNQTILDKSNIRHPYQLMLAFFVKVFKGITKYFPELIEKHELINKPLKSQKSLSAFEIALRHWYLEDAKIESPINGSEVGKKYADLKSGKNIELAFNDIYNKRASPNKTQLMNVHNSLVDFPDVQKAIKNVIDQLK